MDFPLDYVRGSFPSLRNTDTIYFDNAVAPRALGVVESYDENGFEGDPAELLRETRESLAYFLNCNVDWAEEEIHIAADAAELARGLSVALAKDFEPSSRIIATDLDDDWSLRPWLALKDRGIEVEMWPIKRPGAGLDASGLDSLLSDRTRLVAMTKASSAVGSVLELLPVALGVQDHPSAMLVNWSTFLPHGAIDVRFLRADFVLASTRTFFGSKVGFLWGKRDRMRQLRADAPDLFESHDLDTRALVSFASVLRYVEELGLVAEDMQLQPSEDYGRRRHMRRGMQAIRHYERSLTALLLRRFADVTGATVYGIKDAAAAAHRLPHVLFNLEGWEPSELAAALGERGIRVSHGDGGSPHLMRTLGLPEEKGGVLVSLLHYNSEREVERLADALHDVTHVS